MTIWFVLVRLFLGVVGGESLTQPNDIEVSTKNLLYEEGYYFWQKEIAIDGVTENMKFLYDPDIFREKWDTLPHPRFWRNVMALSKDTLIINVASCRQELERVPADKWHNLSEKEKTAYKKEVCTRYDLDTKTELFVTTGRSHFYDIHKALPDIPESIEVFVNEGVDPWYAQAILLIESPGRRNAKSSVGANGPFQLMRSVAREHGLTINKRIDERTDLIKSARAASSLIRKICIPKARKIIEPYNLDYEETDIWFRLLVLHVYHAGAGNVAGAVQRINPTEGGIPFILEMWSTTYRGFQNQSQNYTQIALASMLRLYQLLKGRNEVLVLS